MFGISYNCRFQFEIISYRRFEIKHDNFCRVNYLYNISGLLKIDYKWFIDVKKK